MSKAHVEGLRDSDLTTLSVLAGDLLRYPLARLDLRSVCDLLALAEHGELPVQLGRDLVRFRDQMLREFWDLPDGPPLESFLQELTGLDPARVPESLRVQLTERGTRELNPGCARILGGLQESLGETGASSVRVQEKARQKVEKIQARRAPAERERSRAKTSRRPPRPKNPERAAWIREDIVHRLKNYPDLGLKEAVLVAGTRHRSPWNDLHEPEILSVIRQMERADLLRRSVGRISLARMRR